MLTATCRAEQSATGLWSGVVDYVHNVITRRGFLDRADALAAARSASLKIGRTPIMAEA